MRIDIRDIKDHLGKEITLRGWVRNWRKSSSKLRFIILRDGSGEVQCVAFKPDLGEEMFETIKDLTIESSVEIDGIAEKHPQRESEYELKITGVRLVHKAIDYPIGKKEHGADFLLSNRHLWLRSSKQWAAMRLRSSVYRGIERFLEQRGFVRFDSPILTPNACEGTTTLFEVPYFDLGKAYLSQSGQLYLEPACMSLGRVYDFGPVFRAEKSKTRKHLTEFWMMDAEMAFYGHHENMQLQEDMIRWLIRMVISENLAELEVLERDIDRLKQADAPFKVLTHRQAVDILRDKGSEIDYQSDFGAQDETLITEDSPVPVFIEKWPRQIKAFYMKRDPQNEDLVLGSDLIAPDGFGELIGGSQREDDHDLLLSRMQEENMPIEPYQWYLDCRKYGSVPHSGFGIGLERLVCWLGGIPHVREAIPFPRMIYRLEP